MSKNQNEYSKAETTRRADNALRVALSTPHKPHSQSKVSKPSAKRKMSPGRAKLR
jgi:hypothetical protein